MPGADAIGTPGVAAASSEVIAPSAGAVLRAAAYVTELLGDDRVESVCWYGTDGTGKAFVRVSDPFHAETAAHLLGLDGPVDLAATGERAATGTGAHSAWSGIVQGCMVEITSDLRPGALPGRRPWNWRPEHSRPVPYVLTAKAVA